MSKAEQPSAGDNLTGLKGWPKILAQFGLIGVVTLLMVSLVVWQRVDAAADREVYRQDRAATLNEAQIAHKEMQRLTVALEAQTRATWRLIEEVRAAKPKEDQP